MPSTEEMASATAPKPRRTFCVQLDSSLPVEINFKQLMIQSASQSELPTPRTSSSNTVPTNSLPSMGKPELIPATTRSQRFNIIEHLEKRYGGGSILNDGDESDVGGGLDRRDDDDLYDSEDSFIDDAELQQNIEDVWGQNKVKTKHSGFFVNAGDKIETLEKEEDEDQISGEKAGKTKRGKKRMIDGPQGSFMKELSDAASEWQPDEEVVRRLEVLRMAVQELAETMPIPKVFPRSLDESLRAVDKLVVEAHPNKWRVTGYFATLMTFLPYTKQYLKSNMLRLEARDVARNEKEKLDTTLETLAQHIAMYEARFTSESADAIKEDKELGTMLHALLELQDEWVSKENDYRQMLKTEDKKHMKEPDYKPLNQRQERNRMYNRVLALFTPGLTDLQTLRALNKAAKVKTPKRPAQPKAPVKGATVTAKKPTEPSNGTNAPVKRSIKPFKSRMIDEVPPFVEADFEDVEQ
ncbi:unnamed protein product [Peronospora belbahrii]|uniref:Hpc2-related domain-containing protein n=1 Tax=Peronospora belbahrii TaxID=622444 RepID=A0AAU9KK24_9STRA|nr:unnamed protein product [Peronospora belbahrii]CAH0518648.1 unnamed protein product [Peronospora belbahrii]